MRARSSAVSHGSAGQNATPAAENPPAPASPPKPVDLPDGDGKAIATISCQKCHKLTNLTNAHKSLEDWSDTVNKMIGRGAEVPEDKVDTLVNYLAKNFGPKDATAAPKGPAAANPVAPPAQSSVPPSEAAELPDGDGKPIAAASCLNCHKPTYLTNAHKSLEDWRETVGTMIGRGAEVPDDKVDTLVDYLAKNFGPKTSGATSKPSPQPQ
jgi:cytochrome c5